MITFRVELSKTFKIPWKRFSVYKFLHLATAALISAVLRDLEKKTHKRHCKSVVQLLTEKTTYVWYIILSSTLYAHRNISTWIDHPRCIHDIMGDGS